MEAMQGRNEGASGRDVRHESLNASGQGHVVEGGRFRSPRLDTSIPYNTKVLRD